MTNPKRTLPYELAPGIFWLGGCIEGVFDGKPVHGSSYQYLILGESQTLLVDPGSPSLWERMDEQLAQVLDGRKLDWVFPTHSEIPHAGNLGRVLDKYPEAKAVGDLRDYHLFFPDYVDRFVTKGDYESIDLGGGFVFHFLPAIVKDLETSQWGYEASGQVLFSADGFQQFHSVPELDQSEDDEPLHLPGHCLLTTAEAPELLEDIETQALLFRLVHFGLRFIDPAYTQRLLHELLQKYPTRTIAPSHGFLIVDPEHDLAVFRRVNEFAMKDMYEPTYSSTLTR